MIAADAGPGGAGADGQELLDRWQHTAGRLFVIAGAAGVTGAAAGLGGEWAVATLVAGAAGTTSPYDPQVWLVTLAVFLAVRAVAAAVSRQFAALGAQRVVAQVHGELLDRVLRSDSPLSRPDRFGAGATAVAVLDEVDRLAPYFARFPLVRLQATVVPVLCLAAVATVSPFSALLLVLATPLVPLYGWLTGGGAATLAAEHAEAARGLAMRFHEALLGLPTLRGLGVIDQEERRLRDASRDEARHAVAVLRLAFVATGMLELVATLSLALVAGYVGLSLLGYLHIAWLPGSPDLRTGLFALLVAPAYFAPLRALAAAYHQRAEAVAAAVLVDETLPQAPEPPVPPTARQGSQLLPARPRAVEVVVEGLSVDYPGCRTSALQEVHLQVLPGTTVVVVGPSGAGKSTLLAALAGELGTEQQGYVTWNGTDVRDHPTTARRATVGWLRQRTYLFPGTVEHNITFGQPCTPGEVAEAAAHAGFAVGNGALHADVATLSGGERQRISIARLLLRDAPVLLLDEPTAHLDTAAEAALLPVLRTLCAGRASVIATHSLGLLKLADETIQLDRGRSAGQLRGA